jgi:hypothetical protein
MNHYQFAIIGLLSMQAVTLWLLWKTQQTGEWFRRAWIRESDEILKMKREQN